MKSTHKEFLHRIDALWLAERITKRVWLYLSECLRVAIKLNAFDGIDFLVSGYEQQTKPLEKCDRYLAIFESQLGDADRAALAQPIFPPPDRLHSGPEAQKEAARAAVEYGDAVLFALFDDEIMTDIESVKARLERCVNAPEGGAP